MTAASITSTLLSPITAGAGALVGIGLHAIGSWVLGGAKAALEEVARLVDVTTAPHLESAWFSSTYWRVAGLAGILTLPFLFAAAIQALLRADLALLGRAALGYLPLAMLGVMLAAPLVMLLLAATDQMCAVVTATAAGGGANFLKDAGIAAGGASALAGSPFLAVAVGLLIVGAALALALELLIREAAVYVVVLMLPLAFAGLVWPARRVWALRLVELLVALILSKFVIVAVLSLAGAAYGAGGTPAIARLLTAMALVMLATFAPWALVRILPFTELAAGAAGSLRSQVPSVSSVARTVMGGAPEDLLAGVLMRPARRATQGEAVVDGPLALASRSRSGASGADGGGRGAGEGSDPIGGPAPDRPGGPAPDHAGEPAPPSPVPAPDAARAAPGSEAGSGPPAGAAGAPAGAARAPAGAARAQSRCDPEPPPFCPGEDLTLEFDMLPGRGWRPAEGRAGGNGPAAGGDVNAGTSAPTEALRPRPQEPGDGVL